VDILKAVRLENPGALLKQLMVEDALSPEYVRQVCGRVASRDAPPGALLAQLWQYVANHSPLVLDSANFFVPLSKWHEDLVSDDVPSHGERHDAGFVIGGCAPRGLNPYVWTFALAVVLATGRSSASAACLDLLLACRLEGASSAYLMGGAWAVADVAGMCPRALASAHALAVWCCANALALPSKVVAAFKVGLGPEAVKRLREVPERDACNDSAGVSCMMVVDGRLVPAGKAGPLPAVHPDCPMEVFVALRHARVPADNPLHHAALLFMGYFTDVYHVLMTRAKLVYPVEKKRPGRPWMFTDAEPDCWAPAV
jgi:hypothetical protein